MSSSVDPWRDWSPYDPVFPNLEHVDPDNPFLALFADRMKGANTAEPMEEVAEPVREERAVAKPAKPQTTSVDAKIRQTVTEVYEASFLFTVNEYSSIGKGESSEALVFLKDLSDDLGPTAMGLDADVMERAVFERLQMAKEDLAGAVINGNKKRRVAASGHAVESR